MGWRDLLMEHEKPWLDLPWLGGRAMQLQQRRWIITGPLPLEHGWYAFRNEGKTLRVQDMEKVEPGQAVLQGIISGYLVGDRLVEDGASATPTIGEIMHAAPRVHLLEPGLDCFSRVQAGRTHEHGPLIYDTFVFPLGPEPDVHAALQDGLTSCRHVTGVSPGLDAAFQLEVYHRAEVIRRREELARLRVEEQARLEKEAQRGALIQRLGDGASRRQLAAIDFDTAAQAALRIGDAELLNVRRSTQRGEFVVQYRLDARRYECVCDERLRIVSSGICLTDHRTGVSGDTLFTLESLPGVVREAARTGKLVVYRRVGNEDYGNEDED